MTPVEKLRALGFEVTEGRQFRGVQGYGLATSVDNLDLPAYVAAVHAGIRIAIEKVRDMTPCMEPTDVVQGVIEDLEELLK